MELTEDQAFACTEIIGRYAHGARHLLTGFAGTGKTTLMQEVARLFLDKGKRVVLTAPTHKAVAVLKGKVQDAPGLGGIGCSTIHSLLSLKPKAVGARTVLTRSKQAKDVTADVVIIDECSMVSADLMGHINRHLRGSFVLFVGDPAQLPPVEETESETFKLPKEHRSHLAEIVRQAQGNPILKATKIIRDSQRADAMDWSWAVKDSDATGKLGVYCPNGSAEEWMKKAFTSARFNEDRDSFRYLCWTNARVADVNRKVRHWIYGDTEAPFSVGESVLFRAPVIENEAIVFATNEEAVVHGIKRGVFSHFIEKDMGLDAIAVAIPSWVLTFRTDDGKTRDVHIPEHLRDYQAVEDRLTSEQRWEQRQMFRTMMGKVQSIFALTVHTSQGSTFDVCFVDVPDIKRRATKNAL